VNSFFVKARQCLAFLLFASVALFSGNSLAGSVTVFPLRVTFDSTRTADVVTVRNTDNKTLTLQTTVHKWTQADGEMVLLPTRDVLLAPPLIEIPPGESQSIRLVLRKEINDKDQEAYRLVLQELIRTGTTQGAQMQMAFRVTLPVFVTAKNPTPPVPVAVVVNEAGQTYLKIKNTGKSHVQITKLNVLDSQGSVATHSSMLYVLPGSIVPVKIPNLARPLRAGMTVELTTDVGPFSIQLVNE
jgi:fimbrial chaperone protein